MKTIRQLEEAVGRFMAVARRWITEKCSGELCLKLRFIQGGIRDWSIVTESKHAVGSEQ